MTLPVKQGQMALRAGQGRVELWGGMNLGNENCCKASRGSANGRQVLGSLTGWSE